MQRTARFSPKRAMEALTRHAGDGANRSILALNAVCCETALRLKLRDEPTLRGRRKSVVVTPWRTSTRLYGMQDFPLREGDDRRGRILQRR